MAGLLQGQEEEKAPNMASSISHGVVPPSFHHAVKQSGFNKAIALQPLVAHSPRFGAGEGRKAQQIRREYERLKAEEKGSHYTMMMRIGIKSLLGPIFPVSLMTPLPAALSLPMMPFITRFTMKDFSTRAMYNVTGNRNDLNPVLPYRTKLSSAPDAQADLKRYDKLVDTILKKAEFYEVEKPKGILSQLQKLGQNDEYAKASKELDQKMGFDSVKMIFKAFGDRSFRQSIHASHSKLKAGFLRSVKDDAVKAILQDAKAEGTLKALDKDSADPASRVFVASQIAELCFKNPALVEQVLKSKNGHPLRFLLTTDNPRFAAGQYFPGLNAISLNKKLLWMTAKRNTTAQHEFIHCASELNYKARTSLPTMSEEQKKQFKAARIVLIERHETLNCGWFSRLKYWVTGKPVNGFCPYAFANNSEFITASLDAFKTNPKGLRKTEPGKQIYGIYKELFRIDPLNDIPASPQGFWTQLQEAFKTSPRDRLEAAIRRAELTA